MWMKVAEAVGFLLRYRIRTVTLKVNYLEPKPVYISLYSILLVAKINSSTDQLTSIIAKNRIELYMPRSV